MNQYLKILQNILDNGFCKSPIRIVNGIAEEVDSGQSTLMLPNQFFSHNMSDGFPILTTRKIPFKSACIELEGFLKGVTSKKWYEDRGCKYWRFWANPIKVRQEIDKVNYEQGGDISWAQKTIQKEQDDLGTIYSHNLRRFGEAIDEDDNGVLKGVDQLEDVLYQLKNYPSSRRMHVTYWNPLQNSRAALPACHTNWTITVCKNYLNLFYSQRSCDFYFGSNIWSYALLLTLLAKEGGFIPGNLSVVWVDCHLYENQLEAVYEQLSRSTYPLPTIKIPDILKSGKPFSIYDWTYEDVELINYKCHPPIKCEVVV